MAEEFGAALVTLKMVRFHGLPPLPMEPIKSTTSGSHEPVGKDTKNIYV
jgi:hypothetical protein